MRRIPLWLTLVPLVAAIAIYASLWSGWARDFQAVLDDWLPGNTATVAGFPYRLEADVANPALSGGTIVKLSATATRARLNRGPWRPELTVIAAEAPRFTALVGPEISASVTGKTALTSVKVEAGRLARLSSIIEAASIRLGITTMSITADSLELHLRERIPGTAPAAGPTQPPRGQIVIAGQRVRFNAGAALTLAADLTATGPARLTAYDRWATTGTIEIAPLTLADAHGEVARIAATIVPIGRSGLRFAGTIATVCPKSVAAALAGAPGPSEQRLRAPLRLSFEGTPAALRLSGLPPDLDRRPVRAQLPPCPVLRGSAG